MLIKILFQQVSYLPDIVDANNLYYRTVPSNAYIVDALISLCHMFQWYKVGVFTSNEDHYIQVGIAFGMLLCRSAAIVFVHNNIIIKPSIYGACCWLQHVALRMEDYSHITHTHKNGQNHTHHDNQR